MWQESEQAYPLTRIPTNSTHRCEPSPLCGLHDGLYATKHLQFIVWLGPKQSGVECRIPRRGPQGPRISQCQRPECETPGVNKLQFGSQVFEIDLHLELLVFNHQG
jgi:hypothetical protein